MDVDAAVALLGVEPDASDDTIRRAYLRRIKKTRPDRDAEGFKALRAAHDLLRARAAQPSSPVAFEPPVASADGSEGDGGSGFDGSGRGADDGPGVEEPGPAPDDSAEAWADAFSDADPLTPDPLAVGHQSAVSHLHRASAALEADALDEALDALREALAAAEAWCATEATAWFCEVANELIRRGAPPTAAPLVARWLEIAHRSGALLRMSTEQAALSVLVGELAAVWPDAPADTARYMAQAIADGDLERASTPLRAYAAEHPWGASQLVDVMTGRAPSLLSIYHRALVEQPPATEGRSSRVLAMPTWLYVCLVLLAVWGMHTCHARFGGRSPKAPAQRLEGLDRLPPGAPDPRGPPPVLDLFDDPGPPPAMSLPPPGTEPPPGGPR